MTSERFQPFPLITLWALVESGLGGFMHALHLPFTGIVLGGFSVLIISLLAQAEEKPFSGILRAMLIVIAVKASVNPASPPTAYLAVAFQGISGAFLLTLRPRNAVLSFLFAVIAMLESALQKLLVLTILFGTEWGKAVEDYLQATAKLLHLTPQTNFTYILIGVYLALFAVWGIVLGLWIHRLPAQLAVRANLYKEIKPEVVILAENKGKKPKRSLYFILIISVLLFWGFYLTPQNTLMNALFPLFRTLLILSLWIFVLLPIWKKIIQRWLASRKDQNPEIAKTLVQMQMLTPYLKPLYRHASQHFRGIQKWKEFTLSLIVIALIKDEKP